MAIIIVSLMPIPHRILSISKVFIVVSTYIEVSVCAQNIHTQAQSAITPSILLAPREFCLKLAPGHLF